MRLFEGIDRIVQRRCIDNVQQHFRAGKVAQEQMSETGTLRSAFDQPGNVGQYKALLGPHTNDTQVGVQRGKGIVGDLRPSIGNGRNERGFAGIRHTEEAYISEHLQLQFE